MNKIINSQSKENYIIFDGECGFCNYSIRKLATLDKDDLFLFISNRSKIGLKLIGELALKELSPQTIIVVIEGEVSLKSKGIFNFLESINYNRFVTQLFKFMPNKFCDFFYDLIAENRYKLMKHTCEVPILSIRNKIINS